MNEAKLRELMENEEFVKNILEMDSPDAVCAAFAAEGVEVTPEDIIAVQQKLANSTGDAELSDDDLESVSGGFVGLIAATLLTGGQMIAIPGAQALMGIGVGATITRRRW